MVEWFGGWVVGWFDDLRRRDAKDRRETNYDGVLTLSEVYDLDADVSRKIARALRAEGFDAISAVEIGQAELSDQEHLELAIRSRGMK